MNIEINTQTTFDPLRLVQIVGPLEVQSFRPLARLPDLTSPPPLGAFDVLSGKTSFPENPQWITADSDPAQEKPPFQPPGGLCYEEFVYAYLEFLAHLFPEIYTQAANLDTYNTALQTDTFHIRIETDEVAHALAQRFGFFDELEEVNTYTVSARMFGPNSRFHDLGYGSMGKIVRGESDYPPCPPPGVGATNMAPEFEMAWIDHYEKTTGEFDTSTNPAVNVNTNIPPEFPLAEAASTIMVEGGFALVLALAGVYVWRRRLSTS